jgi:hypothetical protein
VCLRVNHQRVDHQRMIKVTQNAAFIDPKTLNQSRKQQSETPVQCKKYLVVVSCSEWGRPGFDVGRETEQGMPSTSSLVNPLEHL